MDKRLKRQIVGRVQDFFLVSAPGLEQIATEELMSLPLSAPEIETTRGGIEFRARLHEIYAANLYLRTASRILMRVHRFKASQFSEFEKKLSEIPWELYLSRQGDPGIKVTAHRSRLYHSGAIGQRVSESIAASKGRTTFHESDGASVAAPGIFIRLENDRAAVSVDSSGELLHKRGLKKNVGSAPLRETLAAAILQLAGYTGEEILLDPMCGSGTFSLEAAMIGKAIPAGWYRRFAFMDLPSFQPNRWAFIKRKAGEAIRMREEPLIRASDIDAGLSEQFARTVAENQLADAVRVAHGDFFDITAAALGCAKSDKHRVSRRDCRGIVVLNPPYGRRLGGQRQSESLYREIVKKLRSDFRGWRVALILPQKKFLGMVSWPMRPYVFKHGGLVLCLSIGQVR